MFSKFVLLLLSLAILFKMCAMRKTWNTGPCFEDEFTCKRENLYHCVKLDTLCDGADDCGNGKDEICDGGLHILTGICSRPDEKHCKGVSNGAAICSTGCAQCVGRDECTACAVGFSGKYCNETCPLATFGPNCQFDCAHLINEFRPQCTNEVCNSKTISEDCRATCECKRRLEICEHGWVGNRCQVPCTGFKFGRLCLGKCTCIEENSFGCNHRNGTCYCKPRFYGENCEKDCDQIDTQFTHLVNTKFYETNLKCVERKIEKMEQRFESLLETMKRVEESCKGK